MEPFGTVVNAAVVCSALKDYYQDVRDSRDDIQNLYRSVNGLRSLLERVQNVNRGDHLSDDTSAALFQAQSEIVLLEKRLKLDPVTKGSASSKSVSRQSRRCLNLARTPTGLEGLDFFNHPKYSIYRRYSRLAVLQNIL